MNILKRSELQTYREKPSLEKLKLPFYMQKVAGTADLENAKIIFVIEGDHTNMQLKKRQGRFFHYLSQQSQIKSMQNQVFLEGNENNIKETVRNSDNIKSWDDQALHTAESIAIQDLFKRIYEGQLTADDVRRRMNEIHQNYTIPRTNHLIHVIENSYDSIPGRIIIVAGRKHFDGNVQETFKKYPFIAITAKLPFWLKVRDKILPHISKKRRIEHFSEEYT